MRLDFFPFFGHTIRAARQARGLNQAALAKRLGRSPARISELERDLFTSRLGKDRLTLLAEICDALDLVPVLIPRDQAPAMHPGSGAPRNTLPSPPSTSASRSSVFDDVFVDLSEKPEDKADG